jgi:hypothetical protein
MRDHKDYTLHKDEIRYMCEEAPETFPELLEAYLYAAYRHVKEHSKKPKTLVIILDDDDR